MEVNNENLVISIFGLPGSGKSTIAKEFLKDIKSDQNARLVGDYFLKNKPKDIEFKEYITEDFYDWKLIEEYLEIEINSFRYLPGFDFKKFEHIGLSKTKQFIKKEISFIDSTFAYKRADIRILVELDDEIRKERIISRLRADDEWKKFYLDNWESVNSKLKNNLDYRADLRLNSLSPIDKNIALLKKNLSNYVQF